MVTSVNGVAALGAALERVEGDARWLVGVEVVAIGPATARELKRIGLRADHVPADHRAEGVLELLTEERVDGTRVLLPRAEVARDILPETLRERGATVDLIPVYRTEAATTSQLEPGLGALRAGEVDVVTFTSASTATSFAAAVDDAPALCVPPIVAAIGPVTAEACAHVGIEVDVIPSVYTLPALVEAIAAELARSSGGPR